MTRSLSWWGGLRRKDTSRSVLAPGPGASICLRFWTIKSAVTGQKLFLPLLLLLVLFRRLARFQLLSLGPPYRRIYLLTSTPLLQGCFWKTRSLSRRWWFRALSIGMGQSRIGPTGQASTRPSLSWMAALARPSRRAARPPPPPPSAAFSSPFAIASAFFPVDPARGCGGL